VLVGDGPERVRLARRHAGCHFVGAKVGEELATHYASGDLFLFPSLTETFGNVVTEAMASGLVVNAFDYAAAHEYIRQGSNGLLVPCGDDEAFIDSVLAAVEQPTVLKHMRQAARRTAESLSWARVIVGLEERLSEMLRRRRLEDIDRRLGAVRHATSGNGA
jgi:glycosyltransferase involved in cell wall biosynthesis